MRQRYFYYNSTIIPSAFLRLLPHRDGWELPTGNAMQVKVICTYHKWVLVDFELALRSFDSIVDALHS